MAQVPGVAGRSHASKRWQLNRRRREHAVNWLFSKLAFEQLESRAMLSLTHLYTFNNGTANDSVGGANGTLLHGATIANGWLNLQNGGGVTSGSASAQYLQLPAGVLPTSGSATIEVWHTTSSVMPNSSKIFAFGDQSAGTGNSYLYYTPRSGTNDSRAVLRPAVGAERVAALAGGTFNGAPHMAAVVIDSAASQMRLYVDGSLISSAALSGTGMNSINPLLAYLGRSLNDADAAYNGSIDELRIYNNAESTTTIAAAYEQGAAQVASTTPARQMENLGRGVVAVRASASQVFVSWRLLALNAPGIGFNVYRSANGGAAVKLNASPLTAGTNYTDGNANAAQANSYFVRPVLNGVEQAASGSYLLPANSAVQPLFNIPLRNISGNAADYYVHLSWVGDLDGDGEYDFVVDRIPTIAGVSDKVEAYKRDGTFLWAVDMGPNSLNKDNIEPSSSTISVGNWDGVTVYDLDGDGKAEVLLRTANGVLFGNGATLSYPTNNNIQFISVLSGMTGAERARVQVPTDFLSDGPLACSMGIGYLDGVHPSLVCKMKNRIGSGSFNLMVLAFDFNGTSITQKWKWKRTDGSANPDGHQIRIVDVDLDGKDEVVDIGYVLNGNGTLKYSMGPTIVHGDRTQIGDFDPDRPGLEGYAVQQDNPSGLIEDYYDAATGQILHSHFTSPTADNGRGIAADIDPNFRGFEYWSFYGIYNSHTPVANQSPLETQLTSEPNRPWPNFRIWWDGDVLSENLNETKVEKWIPSSQTVSRLLSAHSSAYGAIDSWRRAPTFYGDIFGDWREEIIYEKFDHTQLLIFTTTTPSNLRIYTPAQNPEYRNCMTIKGYMQSHLLDYYLGDGMATPPRPNIAIVGQNQPPTVATAASAAPNPAGGTTTSLSVLGADDAGESNLTYTWSTTGTPPAAVGYSVNGANAAKNATATFTKAGTYDFLVTITDGGTLSTTSSVSVIVDQTLTSITVSPASVSIPIGLSQPFSATGFDQFGDPLSVQPVFTWSVDAGSLGNVDAAGVYTAASTPTASDIVRATSGSKSGTATVNVVYLKGDFNLDGHLNVLDISAMLALADLNAYKSEHGLSGDDLVVIGDLNSDTRVNNGDVQALLNLLIGGGGSGASRTSARTAPPSSPSADPADLTPTGSGGSTPTMDAAAASSPSLPRVPLLTGSGHIASLNSGLLMPAVYPSENEGRNLGEVQPNKSSLVAPSVVWIQIFRPAAESVLRPLIR